MAHTTNKFNSTKELQEWMSRYPDFRDQIKILRQSLGITQEQLAKKVNRTPRSIRTIENNEANPRITTLQKIADALNADLVISLVPPADFEISNESLKQPAGQLANLHDFYNDRTSHPEQPPTPAPRDDIQIGETD